MAVASVIGHLAGAREKRPKLVVGVLHFGDAAVKVIEACLRVGDMVAATPVIGVSGRG